VTGVTAGTSARRSTATVLLDDAADGAVVADPSAESLDAAPGEAAAAPDAADEAAPAPVVSLHARPPVPGLTSGDAPNTTAVLTAGADPDDAAAAVAAPPVPVVENAVTAGSEPADAPGPGRRSRRRERRGPTLREQRRQRTREAIVDAAAELFVERGFDHVSVMEIAQRAGVVEKTVFNHFPVKEGLVFEADPPMRAALLDAVRRRPAGESVAAAAGGFVVAAVSQLGSPAAAQGVAEMARVIGGSRTLQAREREILGTLTDTLAEQITLETRATGSELEPWLAANAVLGLYSALLELARDRVLAGESGPELVEQLRTRGRRGLALLQFGLAGYAKRR